MKYSLTSDVVQIIASLMGIFPLLRSLTDSNKLSHNLNEFSLLSLGIHQSSSSSYIVLIDFWLCRVFIAVCRLSPVAASRGYAPVAEHGP